jgi:hypothetical protein
MISEKENDGLKYFIYYISQNNKFSYITADIRKIIWDYAKKLPQLVLHICNTTIKLNIHIL